MKPFDYETAGPLEKLLHSRKFLMALLGIAQTILFQFVPDFPEEVWLSINGLIVVLITMIAWEDAAEKRATKEYYVEQEEIEPEG